MVDTGRTTKQEAESTVKPTSEPGTLEAAGYAIRPATKGGGFILYKLGEKEEAIDLVRETQSWLDETVNALKIQPNNALKLALIKAKSTPKKTDCKQKNLKTFDIVTSSIHRLAPDSGTMDGRAYLGLWLPTKVTDENGKTLTHTFYLLFNDGELIPGDPETLGERDIYLVTQPIFTTLKISVETAINLAELPRINSIDAIRQLIEILKKYIEFDDSRCYIFTAIWIIGTYFHKRFSCYPYYYLNAVKRSGKTKLLTILSLVAYNAVFSPNMSTSSLFRLTQSAGATTLVDETEDLNDPEKKGDFRQLFNSGYKRGAVIYRSEKGPNDSFVPTPYDPYSPKGLANINGLEDVLEDRCITLTMKRGRNKTVMNRDIPLDDPMWVELRDTLSRLYLQDFGAVEHEYNQTQDVNSVVSVVSADSVVKKRVLEKNNIYVSRTWELWRPILSLAKCLYYFSQGTKSNNTNNTNNTNNNELTPLEQLLDLSVDLILEKDSENASDPGESLLLMGMLKQVTVDNYYRIDSLKEAANQFIDTLPQWFNPKWIGRALKRLGFKEKRRYGKGVEYRLTPTTVADMAERLGVTLPEETPRDSKDQQTTLPIGNNDSLNSENSVEQQLTVKTETSGLRRLQTSKPTFFVKDIPVGEKCDCGKFAVTKEIMTPQGDILGRCQSCFEDLRLKFPGANWKSYDEASNFEEKGQENP